MIDAEGPRTAAVLRRSLDGVRSCALNRIAAYPRNVIYFSFLQTMRVVNGETAPGGGDFTFLFAGRWLHNGLRRHSWPLLTLLKRFCTQEVNYDNRLAAQINWSALFLVSRHGKMDTLHENDLFYKNGGAARSRD